MITVNGTGFTTNDVVLWNGSPRVTIIAPMNTTVATAQITKDDIATIGIASVAVSLPNQVVATPSLGFPVTGPNNPTPNLSSLSPNSAAHGAGDFEMRLSGSGFGANAFVEWNGTFVATAFISLVATRCLYSGGAVRGPGIGPRHRDQSGAWRRNLVERQCSQSTEFRGQTPLFRLLTLTCRQLFCG